MENGTGKLRALLRGLGAPLGRRRPDAAPTPRGGASPTLAESSADLGAADPVRRMDATPKRPTGALDRYAARRIEAGLPADALLRAAAVGDRAPSPPPAGSASLPGAPGVPVVPPLGRPSSPTPSWAERLDDPAARARRKIQRAVDNAIEQAMARGEFTNLPGRGKPIPAELLTPPGDHWLAGKALSNSGFLPPWLQVRQELDAELVECRRLVERTERFPPLVNRQQPLLELRQRLEAVRDKARRYNLMVPSLTLQRPLPKTDELLRRMARALGADEA